MEINELEVIFKLKYTNEKKKTHFTAFYGIYI